MSKSTSGIEGRILKKSLSSNELRALFLDFFRRRGHAIVASSPLIPGSDPTLLFTNAGMVQFKDVFLGKDRRPYVRAASSQRCVRAGGKHNDLENVGYTARHHTFFEMLGNFSFGDYFKREAIQYAWEFVTGKDWLGIDPTRLMVTVYATDDEAYDIWHGTVGLPAERIVRIGDKPGGGSDNFWQMGETGPCGPCSEIFYDHGPEIPGGPPGSPDAEGDRWIEIWNLVFMQYDRSAIEGTFDDPAAATGRYEQVLQEGQTAQLIETQDKAGQPQYKVVEYRLTPLPKPSVDTGMGLERTTAVMQGVHSNYEIDSFRDLIRAAAEITGTREFGSNSPQVGSLRVIADHIRACSFLIIDGVLPANEGRGYVLRRIIRRAIRHGYKLGMQQPFFYKLVATLERVMGEAYPELTENRSHVEKVLQQEELRFAETLATGMKLLEVEIARVPGGTIAGDVVFKLYDTYGFPIDLTADVARERGVSIDEPGFEVAMQAQREQARAASKFGADLRGGVTVEGSTEFGGYETLVAEGRVVDLIKDGVKVERLVAGDKGQVVLDRTPFYAESGGQVGDKGELTAARTLFEVSDTLKLNAAHAHVGVLKRGEIALGDTLTASVDGELRAATRLNHTATHLLHAALREVLGNHVTQKGSLVAPDRLRFDFSHYQGVTPEELQKIERLVNGQIRANAPAETRVMPYDKAVEAGAMALFGEKYADEVRVLRVGKFSMELCGGTHVERAGDIGVFKIVGESGVAAGVRRIEALTGEGALAWIEANDALVREVSALVRGNRDDVRDKVTQLLDRNRKLEKELQQLKSRLAGGQGAGSGGGDLADRASDVGGIKVLAARIDGADAPTLRDAVDRLKSKLKSAVIVLAAVENPEKVLLVAGVTQDQTARIKAGELVGQVAQQVGGRGGGRPDMAQAGGSNPAALDVALASVEPWVKEKLGL